jgi:hypothetical protein
MSGNAQHRKKPIPTNNTKDPSSKFRDDISPPLVANLVNRTYDVLHGPSRGAKDEECTLEQSGNLVNWMWNLQSHKASDAPPESSSGYTVKDMINPKVSTDLPSRGKDEAFPPTYPPESSSGYTVKDMINPKVSTDLSSRGKDEASPPTYPPESSSGYTVKDMINPKVSPNLSSRGKDEASPPTYPKGLHTKNAKPGIIHRIRGGEGTTTSKKVPKKIAINPESEAHAASQKIHIGE